jgi:hypothetical protein
MTTTDVNTRWRDRVDRHLLKEGYTMALYSCVVLLATLRVTHDTGATSGSIELVWGTTVGLALAHAFAFSWAGHLVDRDDASARSENRHVAVAQIAGSVAVAIAISIVVLITPQSAERSWARVCAAGLIGGLVYAEERWSRATRRRSLVIAAIALGVGLLIALIKNHLTH